MGGENKFFFEEDVSAGNTGVDVGEQASLFAEGIAEIGIISGIDSMAPKGVELIVNDVKETKNSVIKVEYGIVDNDYVLHVTPIHPQRNLKAKPKLDAAIKTIAIEMNKVVPYDLRVDIHLPQEDWDIKVISFIIRGGAVAWNLDKQAIEDVLIPSVCQKLTDICVKL